MMFSMLSMFCCSNSDGGCICSVSELGFCIMFESSSMTLLISSWRSFFVSIVIFIFVFFLLCASFGMCGSKKPLLARLP